LGLQCEWLFQQELYFHGILGIWQGHLHSDIRQFQREILLYVIRFIKEDVGLRVPGGIRRVFEDVSLDIVTAFFWVQYLFPNLMD